MYAYNSRKDLKLIAYLMLILPQMDLWLRWLTHSRLCVYVLV